MNLWIRPLVVGLVFLLAGCLHQLEPYHPSGLPPKEVVFLEAKANTGDGNAARSLANNYAFLEHDEEKADHWLVVAARLQHPQSQRDLAYLIKEYGDPYREFGPTRQEAVRKLLTAAAQTEGNACRELAEAYEEGYFGRPNEVKAREYLLRGAGFGYRMCWTEVAPYLQQGRGGPKDPVSAYYWISLEAQCVDPRSIGGRETWALRDSIAPLLSKDQLKVQWLRIDDYMSRYSKGLVEIDFSPFLGGAIRKEDSAEGKRLSSERERAHRKALL